MRIDLKQLDFVDARLQEIVTRTEKELGVTLTVTSLYRPGDPGVHGTLPGPGRGRRGGGARQQSLDLRPGQAEKKGVHVSWCERRRPPPSFSVTSQHPDG